MNSSRATYLYIILLVPLIYFAIFLHLDSLPFRVWDEAYLATHTYEMMHDHDYIVTHSFGEPEMSNTKPPLVIWCMVLSCRVLGFNELAVRLPNALSGVAICFIIFLFSSRILKSSFKGFLSVLVLISSSGFIRPHVIRSGEYDAILLFFITIYCFSYFLIIENRDTPQKHRLCWLLFTLALTCAILTKGVAAFFALPGLFVYTLFQKKLLLIIKSKEFYISTFFVVVFGLGYYLLREHYNHGYIQSVSENELGGRYLNPQIQTSRAMYLNEIVNIQFTTWLPFAFIGFFAGLNSPIRIERRLVVFCSSIVLLLVLILSFGSTRLEWYDAPAFPFLALLSGFGVYFVIYYLFRMADENLNFGKVSLIAVIIFLFSCTPYANIILANMKSEEDPWDANSYNLTHFIELKEKNKENLNGYKIAPDWMMWRASFCQTKKWESKGQKIDVITNLASLTEGDRVVVGSDAIKNQINQIYRYKTVDSYKNVEVFEILGHKAAD